MMDHKYYSPHLALLIAAPHAGEAAMVNDMMAMLKALQGRGYSPDQILCLHGRLDRRIVLAFLQAANRRAGTWADGSVLLHVSGHGFFAGETTEDARPGLLFDVTDDIADDNHLFWDEFFAALVLPAGVRLTLLPDL